ncbi:hypothetical protein EMIHUDRAFT_213197 [Emiliania huxleyi CCMP1516]|uniref:Lysosomal Pro-X carboxypeptidase n=2 Tax=Emiliania huxleyi TaxID=2903 RepID=A0A0D3INV4_EMIH1|nr:hypothetical protein EMIHUDRAFT_213197 [Emiliania huxleyi CCMP1516]EOD12939.1 hypothetical protein EMIHUDRAFT_213197 [Emiliania huxleyi CCMP1516]|eukprot:XP_005765368.1 hypothetical protein EMIHUDRAFT_213197 [Emiliania huxleyi CCMP1516]
MSCVPSLAVDHFGGAAGTFPQRLCLYDKWWKRASKGGFKAPADAPGPILFYTGNESPVDEYVNNTGLMWELAEDLGALIVFAEHRYEPLSHPALCGTQRCFAYCTTAQAIADWVTIIAALRRKHKVRAPVVAFGGSYGGMLAGWLRMKYPEVVDGVIAASAPIWQLAGTVQRETLDMPAVAISKGVSAAGGATDRCRDNLKAAWPLLQEAGRTAAGLRLLSRSVKACSPLHDARALTRWAQSPYFFLAEGNYPFPSTYITFSVTEGKAFPLPSWPMRVACERGIDADFGVRVDGSVADVNFTLSLGDLEVAVDWADATGNGDTLTAEQLEASGDRSACAFTGTLSRGFSWGGVCSNDALSQVEVQGVGRDIYWPPSARERGFTVESVVGPRGLRPRPGGSNRGGGMRGGPLVGDKWSEWMQAYYGGRNVSRHRNIIALVLDLGAHHFDRMLGAHHLDLMFADPRNPPCFAEARAIEERMIRRWIQEAYDAI